MWQSRLYWLGHAAVYKYCYANSGGGSIHAEPAPGIIELLSITSWGVFHSQGRHSPNCTATAQVLLLLYVSLLSSMAVEEKQRQLGLSVL